METIHRKTQVPMGRRCQERHEEDKTHKMDRTSPRSPQMERNCWEGQDSTRVVQPSKKKKIAAFCNFQIHLRLKIIMCLFWFHDKDLCKIKWETFSVTSSRHSPFRSLSISALQKACDSLVATYPNSTRTGQSSLPLK